MLTSQLEITREELRSVTDALCIVEASNVVSYATHTSGLHGFHINRLRVLKLCAFWPTESSMSKTSRYKATSGQHSLRKDVSRGAYSAGARSALMRMRT